ncbi:right-handed parallel beta-helix repeat-containing protein [Motilimonas sp. 1_MG-2023]|uniref:right-handed parallel beta-helix repeat-containing protein n=1 Tax=Motilimonas sp. 1_MG-2023 TaxID=3062672 RepID=UPI0026E1CE0B|nr:right-handed parallel beta-helix repeat-containing protein [Motilimonas sp. 1_MG-2023]MDO6527726.1 right-handed parallel beta-helix repeat-containing protein [Motilimonas sp. 1_MG-2023]
MRQLLLSVITLSLIACGGGGSDSSPSSASTPTIAPSQPPTTQPNQPPASKTVTINIKAVPDTGGTIIVTPSKASYEVGETVKIETKAKPGYLFNGFNSNQVQSSEITLTQSLVLLGEFIEDNQTVVTVANNEELHRTFAEANQQGGHYLILLEDGEYQLNNTFVVDAANITLRGKSGDYNKAKIAGPKYNNMFLVRASHFKIEYLTIGGAPLRDQGFVRNHIVQIQGERNADYFTLRHSRIIDSQEQMVKVSTDSNNPDIASDYGLIEHNIFEFTTGQALWWYTGGIDAHRAHHWIVRNNTFKNIHNNNPAPGENPDLTEGAIHFWSNSKGTLIENNVIINCDRGIMLGLGTSGHYDGVVRNNFIVTNKDVGIYLSHASNTQVYNNTIWLNSQYANAIEYRFADSINNQISNNLTNGQIKQRNSGQAQLSSNVVQAQSTWFTDINSGDLHLKAPIAEVLGKGDNISGLTHDIDGDPRVLNKIDIGADQTSF